MLIFGNKAKFIFVSCLLLLLFASCDGRKNVPKLEIGHTFYYWESTAESSLGDAIKNHDDFKKLEDPSIKNLRNVLGKGAHYVWVRAEFEIPPEFRNQALGLVIPHLKFAEQLYCNNTFISQYGRFPPYEQSTLFKAHFFSFPLSILHQEGKNTILIKIFTQGKSGISSHSFIQPTQFAYANFEVIHFYHTRIYMLLEGILFFTFILYITFFLNLKVYKEFRAFAFINLATSFFIIPFFATELPVYTNGLIPYVSFIKWTFCIQSYLILYFATSFAIDFHHVKIPRLVNIIRRLILAAQFVVTIFAPSYDALINITPFMLALLLIQGGIGIVIVFHQFAHRYTRKTARQFMWGFLPLWLTIILDVALRLHDNTQAYPYFSVFGWQIAIVIFIIILATRFAHIYRRNEQLTNHLQEEVDIRTRDLQGANYELSILTERLEKEKFRSDLDLQMASIVQQRFFPQPNKRFKGWDIAVYYNSQAIVSGDLYDYYTKDETLNGLSLFDVSGHGISAGLVTMLSKNIIGHAFHKGYENKEPMDKILARINNIMLYEKGEIDNYLTGVLCRFENDVNKNVVSVELGNAGHPYPLKFSADTNVITEITGNDGKKHYGAIGMKGIEISFATSHFTMKDGDILVCFTDGLTETSNKSQEQFGKEYLKRLVKDNHKKTANDLLKLITKALWKFTEGKPLEDDVTIIIAKRTNLQDYISDENEEEHLSSLEKIDELLPADE